MLEFWGHEVQRAAQEQTESNRIRTRNHISWHRSRLFPKAQYLWRLRFQSLWLSQKQQKKEKRAESHPIFFIYDHASRITSQKNGSVKDVFGRILVCYTFSEGSYQFIGRTVSSCPFFPLPRRQLCPNRIRCTSIFHSALHTDWTNVSKSFVKFLLKKMLLLS